MTSQVRLVTPLVTAPAYRYGALITHVYDADTVQCNIDMYDRTWRLEEKIRLYGVNANEIKRSKRNGIGDAHVAKGFRQRNELIRLLGQNADNYPRRVRYHELIEPVPVVIETVRDTSGKFGRLLGILHYQGVNLNERIRDMTGGVEFYDGKEYPPDYPISPPALAA